LLQVGYYRELGPLGSLEWGLVGGPVWRVVEGGALMVGGVEGGRWWQQGRAVQCCGHCRWSGSEVVYLYPGLRLGLLGQYGEGHLKAGREAMLVGSRERRG
jgi:hypothetical protein